MSAKLRLTVACGDYEIVRALKEGVVQPDGLELVVLSAMGSREFNARMAKRLEFDVSELGVTSYVLLRAAGAPLSAIPVFLHRRFRQGFVFVNRVDGVQTPRDLIGRRVGGDLYPYPFDKRRS